MQSLRIKKTLPSVLCLLLCVSLAACSPQPGHDSDEQIFSLLNEHISEYMQDDYENVSRYARGIMDFSLPAPVPLTWKDTGAAGYRITLSEYEDMHDARVIETTSANVDIYNCKTGTRYYWSVTGIAKDGSTKEVASGTFSTADETPRTIYCDGVTNMRDLGGWTTESGRRIKQGLIYRCGRLNDDDKEVVTAKITDKGLKTMAELGIKTEIDLRSVDNNEVGGLTSTSLIPGAKYVQIPMVATMGKIMEKNESQIPALFEVLADENNYPIIFHCSVGTDRTGYVAYLINALLGVGIDDLNRDYLLSNFANIGNSRVVGRIQSDYIDGIDAYPGDTLSIRVENYLLSIGVPREQIDSVRSILLN